MNIKIKGISLIVLVITMIVIIILAGAVILSLSQNNPITSANKAIFEQDIDTFKSELLLYKTSEYVNMLGFYDERQLYADSTTLKYSGRTLEGSITTIIEDIERKYPDEFEIRGGQLVYKGFDNDKREWVKDLDIAIVGGKPLVNIATDQTLPIKPGEAIEYTMKFTSDVAITTIALDGKIILTDEEKNILTQQPEISIGQPEGTDEDTTRSMTLTVNTTSMANGGYRIKILSGAVINANGIANEEKISDVLFEIDSAAPDIPIFITNPLDLTYWVPDSVQVKIVPNDSKDKLEYSLNGIDYLAYISPITIISNGIIYAKEIDEANNVSNVAILEITKIDNIVPQNALIDLNSSGSNIIGTIMLTDNESGININQSRYVVTTQATIYGVDDPIWNTGNSFTTNPQSISIIEEDGNYYVHVLSIDNVGRKQSNVSDKLVVTSTGICNTPVLVTGMIPIKWNDTTLTITTADDPTWYDYADKRWANAQTADGSMWVWIPRYEYKISTPHTSVAEIIDVNFIKGTRSTPIDGYIIHPAFTFGEIELTGIWVAKFEATAREGLGNSTALDNVTTKNVKILPGVASWRYIQIGNMFNVCRNMETDNTYGWGTTGIGIDTHMIKNIEWGSVAYLSSSIYGKIGEVWINPNSNYLTGQAGTSVAATQTTGTYNYNNLQYGVNASTTGNVYGIYDMSGGTFEYTASYVNNGNPILNQNGASLISADSKYKDVYISIEDTEEGNYFETIQRRGDAIYETSSNGSSASGWYLDYSYMPNTTYPFFRRGGTYNTANSAGIFSFYRINGAASTYTFRPVLAINNGL